MSFPSRKKSMKASFRPPQKHSFYFKGKSEVAFVCAIFRIPRCALLKHVRSKFYCEYDENGNKPINFHSFLSLSSLSLPCISGAVIYWAESAFIACKCINVLIKLSFMIFMALRRSGSDYNIFARERERKKYS
jgi:hypothetical protein